MAKRNTRKPSANRRRKNVEKVVKNNYKVIIFILIALMIVLTVLYFTGTLQVILDKYVFPSTQEEEDIGDGDTSGDESSSDNQGGSSGGSQDGSGDGQGSTSYAGKNLTTTVDTLKDLVITFLDVGQGDCIILQLPDGKNMIIDSGDESNANKQTIADFTEANGITTFDYLLLTHQDSDHVGNMNWVIDNYEIKYIFRPNMKTVNETYSSQLPEEFNTGSSFTTKTAIYGKFMLSAYNEGCPVEIFYKDSDFTNTILYMEETYTYSFDFLTPTAEKASDIYYKDNNNYSPVVLFEYCGTKIMFTGDAEEKNLGEYVSTYGNAYNVDILKVGHHGSENATTSAFVEAIDPEYAIIQCGLNNKYGHPHAEALQRLSGYDSNMIIYRTDNNGNIVLTIEADGTFDFTLDVEYDAVKNLIAGVKKSTGTTAIKFDIILDDRRLKVA